MPLIEIFFPLGFEKPATLADYMPADGLSLFISDKRLENAAEGVNKEFDELYRRTVREKKLSFPPPDRILASYPDSGGRLPQENHVPVPQGSGT